MALCGSPRACQCAIGSADIGTAGEINGTYPTIDFVGDGTAASPWQPKLNEAWLNALIAATTPVPWLAFPGAGGWTNYGGIHQVCQYRKIGDIVYLRGMAAKAGAANNEVMGTLPVGYRPPSSLIFCEDHGGLLHTRIDIANDGTVILRYSTGGDSTYVTLNNIAFSITRGND